MTKVHRDILERSLAQSKLLFYCCLLWLVCVTTGEVKSHIQKKTIHFISNESKCNHVLLLQTEEHQVWEGGWGEGEETSLPQYPRPTQAPKQSGLHFRCEKKIANLSGKVLKH